jgi:hypothetical protein
MLRWATAAGVLAMGVTMHVEPSLTTAAEAGRTTVLRARSRAVDHILSLVLAVLVHGLREIQVVHGFSLS